MAFEVKNSKNEAENELKQCILDLLSAFDINTLKIAYVYAKNYVEYGVNVTEKLVTVCQNSESLEKAYHKGYCEGYEAAKRNYCDKWRMKNVFDDEKIIPDSTDSDLKACTDDEKEPKFKVGDKILISDAWTFDDDKVECIVTKILDDNHYKVTSYGSEFEVYEHEMELVKEEKPQNLTYKFKIGQIVKKVNGYPDPSTFKILDRFVVNLIHPYYKIGLIDKFFDKGGQERVPNHYEYVPENRLKLSEVIK